MRERDGQRTPLDYWTNGAARQPRRAPRPRRTIRVGLWGGEEQGLLGSRAYVHDHLADVETMALKPEHARLSAVFNSDNGTGRVRGIWLQGNMAARPIFEQWMAPLHDLGVTTIGPRTVVSTDHVSFDNAGIPAFQFMVDRLEYNSRTHHSNMDTFDRVQRDDMIQQATVIAVFAYNAAMRDDKLPRKARPAPQKGRGSTEQPWQCSEREGFSRANRRTRVPGASSAPAARRAAGSRANRRTAAASCRSCR